jgi:CMP/dCMP kinase
MDRIIIAIDGLSGCGKSSTAKEVARRLGYSYFDSGAMYRAATLFLIRTRIDMSDIISTTKVLDEITIEFRSNGETGNQDTYLNGENVDIEIRGLEVSGKVSHVSTISEVRHALVRMQRKIGEQKGVVMDGRDIGTVVFPDAELKIFMIADLDIRAQRRLKELSEKGIPAEYSAIVENLRSRDLRDVTRADSPLKKAADAYEIDTSNLIFEDQVRIIISKATGIISSLSKT